MDSIKEIGYGKATLRKSDLTNSTSYMGVIHSFLVNSSEAEGGFMMLRFIARPGSEPPAHLHHNEHEIFHVLEGEVEFFVEGEGQSFLAKSGYTMHLPRGRAHGLIFRTSHVCALAMLHAVNGHQTVEPFLKAMAAGSATSMDLPDPDSTAEYKSLGPEEVQKAMKLAEEYGFTFLSPKETAERLPLLVKASKDPDGPTKR